MAAVEFALIAGVMVMLLMGMFVYWRVLQAQQSVARATGDGARMVQHLAFGGMAGYNPAKPAERASILQATTDVVNQSLTASGIPPGTAPTQVQIDWTSSQATLSVVYMLPRAGPGPAGGQPDPGRTHAPGGPQPDQARPRQLRQEDQSMLTHLPASVPRPRTRRQGGSLLVQFALLGSVLFLLLGIVDLGYMYYAKRDLQRIADLAATQAAQTINAERSNRAACVTAGEDSITANWPVP